MPNNPHITADYQTLLDCVRNGIESYVPDGSKRAYSVKELLLHGFFEKVLAWKKQRQARR